MWSIGPHSTFLLKLLPRDDKTVEGRFKIDLRFTVIVFHSEKLLFCGIDSWLVRHNM